MDEETLTPATVAQRWPNDGPDNSGISCITAYMKCKLFFSLIFVVLSLTLTGSPSCYFLPP